ncbi:Mediator of RNA polymerase II transcription subunit 18 [Agyrium rufum]|nr:Mediator of RNA polymerase II transcription subunit 18 [Agyrium rufum]
MHELLLFAQVPSSQKYHVLQVLAGVAAMQPQPFVERRIIFKPNRQVITKQGHPKNAFFAQMKGELYYLQAVKISESRDKIPKFPSLSKRNEVNGEAKFEPKREGEGMDEGLEVDGVEDEEKTAAWTLEFRDLPDVPGKRPVTSRLMASMEISDPDLVGYMRGLGYDYTSEYVLRGERYTHNSVQILVHQPCLLLMYFPPPPQKPDTQPQSQAEDPSAQDSSNSQPQIQSQSDPSSGPPQSTTATITSTPTPLPNSALPPSAVDLETLDSSGSFILQASVRVQDGSKPEMMTRGISELVSFRDLMRGVVELEVGDRLALDTRVR